MKKLLISTALFTAPFTGVVSAQNTSSTLSQLASEQERQIAELKTEIASLRSQLNLEQRNNGTQTRTVSNQSVSTSSSSHIVKAGDTFSSISRKYGVSVSALIAANPTVKPTKIAVNQKLAIPQSNSKAIVAAPAPQVKVSAPKSTSQPISTGGSSGGSTYKVAKGDTFYGIAKKHNITLASLTAANPSVNPNALQVGQSIRLNGSAPQSKPAAQPTQVKKSTEAYKPLPKVVEKAPAPAPAPKQDSKATPEPTTEPETSSSYVKQIGDVARTVSVSSEMTFGAFAKQHGTTIAVLNALNGLNLPADEPMAAGSELFVPNN
jgi:LysM repeat protein